MKTKKIFKKTVKYFRELSIVVIGVAITVSIGLWINKKNNEKDLKQYLTALIMELKLNAEMFDEYAKSLQKLSRYADYIQSHDSKSLNQDTLNYYYSSGRDGIGIRYIHLPNVLKTNVFEMFKSSGIMRQMNDKEILESIWDAYAGIIDTKLFLDLCYQIKREETMKEMLLEADGKQIAVRLRAFYSTDLPKSMVQSCKVTSEMLKRTISQLEETL